jgi:hypothetical protein
VRFLASLVALAAVTASFGGTFSTFDSSVSNAVDLGSSSTFAPITQAAPVVSGTPSLGQLLSVQTPGQWRSNLTVTRGYQWQACTSLLVSTCVSIPGATSATYLVGLVGLNLGGLFRVVETATNSYGSATAASGLLS